MIFGEGFQLANPILNFLVFLMEGVNLFGNVIKCRSVRRLCKGFHQIGNLLLVLLQFLFESV